MTIKYLNPYTDKILLEYWEVKNIMDTSFGYLSRVKWVAKMMLYLFGTL